MKRNLIILLVAALPLLAVAALSPEETVSAADRAEKNGSFQQAIDLYTGFIKDYPEHIQRPNVEYRLALCYDSIGKLEPALEHLKLSVAGPAEKAIGKHRPDAFMRIAKLYADAGKHQEACDTLDALLKEGAGLYEDEAQSLRGSYLALLGKHEDAAMLFNVLRSKRSSDFAKEAGYKLAIVWLKSGNLDLAKNAIEEFVQRFPGDQRIGELFIRIARAYFEQKQYKSAVEVCQQVLGEFKDAPEAIEAAFIIALSYRDNDKLDKAIEAFTGVAKMPQSAHNSVLASEALFETAQIYRKQLNDPEKASEYYHDAAIKSRDALTARQQVILEQSLFYEAEYLFQKQKWSAAYDLYAQLRNLNSKINIIERLIYCKQKMSSDGDISIEFNSEEELEIFRKRIRDKPGTLEALLAEIFLIEYKFKQTTRYAERVPPWSTMEPLVEQYAALLKKYPEDVLKQQSQGAYIKMRMGSVYTYTAEDDPNRLELSQRGLTLYEQALAEAPDALFRVESLEGLAVLANRCGMNQKSFEAYQKLYAITGIDPQAVRRPPSDYLQGLVATAESETMVDEALKTMEKVINDKPVTNAEARDARFYVAELHYMKQRYATAASKFKEFVKLYGPPQDANGAVTGAWRKPGQVDPVLGQVYEAAQRVAHCWRTQGTYSNMVAAYKWVADNLDHLNPRVAEAWYMVLTTGVDPSKITPAQKEQLARDLWSKIVNVSTDVGSKAFKEGYHRWVHDSGAVTYVRTAMLKSGQYFGEVNKHKMAGDVFREYTVLYFPDPKRVGPDKKQVYLPDAQYEIACYASGKEYLLAGDYESAVKRFRVFLDELRDSKFRIPALMALGHYGTQVEMFQDAADAYATLLDQYGPPNPVDRAGKPVPVGKDQWLRKESQWNGIRMATPPKWDAGKVRYGLGYLYWKKEDWQGCATVLSPFLEDKELKDSPSRAEAIFMAARSMIRMRQPTNALRLLETIINDHPDFKAVEEVYTDLARAATEVGNWKLVAEYYKKFVSKHADSDRRPYMDLFAAAALVGGGKEDEGERMLRSLAKAETYEDVKAGAYYHLAMLTLKRGKSDANDAARELLKKSLEFYTELPALMQAAKCAYAARDWQATREYLDRVSRNFPKADKNLLDEVQRLRRQIVDGEATARRQDPARK